MPVTIGPGATGDDVKRVQRALARQLLWNPFGPITGVYDATLEASVKLFQQGNGLPATGTVDGATWAELPAYKEASPTVRTGDTGPVVAWLQQALKGQDIVISVHAICRRDRWHFRSDHRSCCSRAADLVRCDARRDRQRQYVVYVDDPRKRPTTDSGRRVWTVAWDWPVGLIGRWPARVI